MQMLPRDFVCTTVLPRRSNDCHRILLGRNRSPSERTPGIAKLRAEHRAVLYQRGTSQAPGAVSTRGRAQCQNMTDSASIFTWRLAINILLFAATYGDHRAHHRAGSNSARRDAMIRHRPGKSRRAIRYASVPRSEGVTHQTVIAEAENSEAENSAVVLRAAGARRRHIRRTIQRNAARAWRCQAKPSPYTR